MTNGNVSQGRPATYICSEGKVKIIKVNNADKIVEIFHLLIQQNIRYAAIERLKTAMKRMMLMATIPIFAASMPVINIMAANNGRPWVRATVSNVNCLH